jgi:hypothetical protein
LISRFEERNTHIACRGIFASMLLTRTTRQHRRHQGEWQPVC